MPYSFPLTVQNSKLHGLIQHKIDSLAKMKEKKIVIFTFFKSVILKKLAREEIEHAQINMPLFEDGISSIFI